MKTVLTFIFVFFLAGLACAQDQGITSERHRENIGKIVWAKERIQFNAQDQIMLTNEFNADDPIYGRVYLPKSLVRLGADEHGGKCPNQTSNYRIKVLVNGESKGVLNEQWFEKESWTTVQTTPRLASGDDADRQNRGVPAKWLELVNELPDGDHAVTFEFWGGPADCEATFAEGGFTLKKAGAATATLGVLPEAKMTEASLQQEMIQAVKDQGWTNEHPVDVVIIEPEWRIIRDILGNIIRREVNTHVVLKKNADGSCRANDISFTQQHVGNSQFGKTEFYGMGMRSYPVACP